MKKLVLSLMLCVSMSICYSQDIGILAGDAKYVTAFDVGKDKRLVVAGTREGELVIWDAHGDKENRVLARYQNSLSPGSPPAVRAVSITSKSAFAVYGYLGGTEDGVTPYDVRFHYSDELADGDGFLPVVAEIDLATRQIKYRAIVKDKFVSLPVTGFETSTPEFEKIWFSDNNSIDKAILVENKLMLKRTTKNGFTVTEFDLSSGLKTNSYSVYNKDAYVNLIQVTENYHIYEEGATFMGKTKFGVKLPNGKLYVEIECIDGYFHEDGNVYYIKDDGTLNKMDLKTKASTVLATNFSTPVHNLLYADNDLFLIREGLATSDFKYTFHNVKTNIPAVTSQRDFDIIYGVKNDNNAFLLSANSGPVVQDVKTGNTLVDFGRLQFLEPRFLDMTSATYATMRGELKTVKFSEGVFKTIADTSSLKRFVKFKKQYDPEKMEVFPESDDAQEAIKSKSAREAVRLGWESRYTGKIGNMVMWMEYDQEMKWLLLQRLRNMEIYDAKSDKLMLNILNPRPYAGYQVLNNEVICLYNAFKKCVEYWNLSTGKIEMTLYVYQVPMSDSIHWMVSTPQGLFDLEQGEGENFFYNDGQYTMSASDAGKNLSPGLAAKVLSKFK